MGILGVIAIPFGFDAGFWRQMGYGIDWMDTVALWVASLPGAFGRVPSFGPGPLLLGTVGLLVIGLLKTPLRWSGAVLAVLAIGWALRTPLPDVLISGDGRTFAMRGADGRDVRDASLGAGIACDPSGCIGSLAAGGLVAYALAPDAFEEDCRRAVLIVTTRDPPPDCAAPVISRRVWRERGALALRRDGTRFVMESARTEGFDRPWAPRPARAATTATTESAGEIAPAPRSPPRDATPHPEDLRPDD